MTPRLRVLADDLTGALDTAARFVPLVGPVPVGWSSAGMQAARVPAAALDTGTRDLGPDAARVAMTRAASFFDGADIAFKKIDSLLRGHVAVELAACLPGFDHCILAPAFPFQNRVTRGGRQLVREPGGWRDTGVSLLGIDPRVRVYDAASDGDLAAAVAAGRTLPGRVLWCGTGGLAGALAGGAPVPRPALPRPILALIGSDQPVSAAQVASAVAFHHGLPDEMDAVIAKLQAGRSAAVTVALPGGTSRVQARRAITTAFHQVLTRAGPLGTLFVSGGETLRFLCGRLGVTRLEVDGEIEPGVPTSIARGGAWDGQRVVSKSGAFGDTLFLSRLLTGG